MTHPAVAADNRRAVERHPFRTKVLLVVGDQHRLDVRSLDLGKGGMGVVSDWNLPVGVQVVVKFSMPVKHTAVQMILNAVVVNGTLAGSIGGFRIGLQFRGVDPQTQLMLEQFTQR
jgi:c-di-GMP-binding flagellar brake protein YcgR